MHKLTPIKLYKMLMEHYGPRSWWPADTPFEVIIGAVLTQNTAWTNVEKAIVNMRDLDLLTPQAISKAKIDQLEKAIHPSGFFRQKAARLKTVSDHLLNNYNGSIDMMFKRPTAELREELLEIRGIGPETGDSILLYAGKKPVFVIDAYTRRLCHRLELTQDDSYDELQSYFLNSLPEDTQMYNEYHALIVEFCKNICKRKPLCSECFLNKYCSFL